jgi:hypothetical protein
MQRVLVWQAGDGSDPDLIQINSSRGFCWFLLASFAEMVLYPEFHSLENPGGVRLWIFV